MYFHRQVNNNFQHQPEISSNSNSNNSIASSALSESESDFPNSNIAERRIIIRKRRHRLDGTCALRTGRQIRPTDIQIMFEKKFKCSTCGESFSHKTTLSSHRKVHSGETLCKNCGQVLSTVSKLKQHMKMIHGIIEASFDEL